MRRRIDKHAVIGQWTRLFFLLWMLFPALARGNAAISIQMVSTATVEEGIICLGDVSEIRSDDLLQVQKLSAIKIGKAPPVGQSRWVNPEEIKLRIKQAGFDDATFDLSAAGPVKVLRRYAIIAPETINAAVKAFILGHAPWKEDQLRIDDLTFDDALTVPPGKVAFLVTAPKHTDWLGPIPFSVQIQVDGQAFKKIIAPATIEVWSDVVVTAKPLGKYQPIDGDDIRVDKVNLARVPSNAILDAKQVLGHRANRNIAANSVLRSDQVEMLPVVKRGDVVQVIAESQILRVEAKAMAKESGAVGDRIQVMNLSSKKIIYAQVVDEQTVEVEF